MSTSAERVAYIKRYYQLERMPDGYWIARAMNLGAFLRGTKEEVCRYARTHWGHFNYSDEAEAFGEIFS